jgi:hypothetical protein
MGNVTIVTGDDDKPSEEVHEQLEATQTAAIIVQGEHIKDLEEQNEVIETKTELLEGSLEWLNQQVGQTSSTTFELSQKVATLEQVAMATADQVTAILDTLTQLAPQSPTAETAEVVAVTAVNPSDEVESPAVETATETQAAVKRLKRRLV